MIVDVILFEISFCPVLKFFDPIPLRLSVIVGTIVWIWLSMSGMDYKFDGTNLGHTTAGMFILGFPFIAVFVMFVSMLAAFIHKHSPKLAWLAVFATLGFLISTAFIGSLPKHRLSQILKIDSAKLEIKRLRQVDSFNDGITTVAVIFGNEATFAQILIDNELNAQRKTRPYWLSWFSDYESTLDRHTELTIFDSDKLTCYHDADSQEIHIYHSSRSLPGE